jgi:hypothetical protein
VYSQKPLRVNFWFLEVELKKELIRGLKCGHAYQVANLVQANVTFFRK